MAAWSPCSRLIAVAQEHSQTIEILDAVTLERLNSLVTSSEDTLWLSFSPDSRLLTEISDGLGLASWDLQTGGPVGTIASGPTSASYAGIGLCFSSTHSLSGKMFAVASGPYVGAATTITVYNLVTMTRAHTHHAPEGHIMTPIWTCGESIRFVIAKPGSITIWEASFTSMHTLIEVGSLPAPDNLDRYGESLFLPALSRLAFTHKEAVLVWDAQDSQLLLNFSRGLTMLSKKSFSPDGRFFACETTDQEFCLWKESPAGYVLHQKGTTSTHRHIGPLLSPNGESIIAVSYSTIQLWRTTDPTPSLSCVSTQYVERANFILDLCPNEMLAAVARLEGNTATVLDLGTGDPWLVINTDMKILALRMTGSTIIVVGKGKIVTWNLPAKDRALCTRAGINDGVQTTAFDYLLPRRQYLLAPLSPIPYTSISPDFNCIAVAECSLGPRFHDAPLGIYDLSTGKCLASVPSRLPRPWFGPDSRELWCAGSGGDVKGWSVVRDAETDVTELEPLGPTAHPPAGAPWRPSIDYEITHDGWVLSPSGKQLLWLPHGWRQGDAYRVWGGRFLGLLYYELLEAVILELGE